MTPLSYADLLPTRLPRYSTKAVYLWEIAFLETRRRYWFYVYSHQAARARWN